MIDHQSIYFILTVAFAYGIATGSFVTMASYRLPRGEEIVFKPSYCPHCRTSLGVRDLAPLFSWAFQRGKCRYCHARISLRYPIIELGLGIVFVLVVYLHSVTVTSLLLLMLATGLSILIVTDIEQFIIPDSVQVALFATGIAWCIYRNTPPQDVVISIAAGLLIGLLLHYGYLHLRKKDGLGWGDVKFLGVAGAWLPVHDFVTFFLFAGLIGTVTGLLSQSARKGGIFPFGPALAVSLFINVLYPGLLGRIFVAHNLF